MIGNKTILSLTPLIESFKIISFKNPLLSKLNSQQLYSSGVNVPYASIEPAASSLFNIVFETGIPNHEYYYVLSNRLMFFFLYIYMEHQPLCE